MNGRLISWLTPSHELATPLTAIKGFAETLLDGALENPELSQKFIFHHPY